MRTRTKIKWAGALYRAVSAGRSLAGLGDHVRASRAGIRWDLDLREGIDFSVYALGMFERSTVKVLQKLVRNGDTVFDIGANIGSHTLHLARAVGPQGRVYAFEPTDFAFQKLTQNLALNPALAPLVTAEQMLLTATAQDGVQAELYASWPLQEKADVHPMHGGRRMSTSSAVSGTLDDYVKRKAIARVDVIKIDVDGHELHVLKGGRACLERFRPRIVTEIAPYTYSEEKSSFDEFVQFLNDLGYVYRHYGQTQALPLDAGRFAKQCAGGQSVNIVLTPK